MFSDDFRGNRSYLIHLNTFRQSSEIWRQSLKKSSQYSLQCRKVVLQTGSNIPPYSNPKRRSTDGIVKNPVQVL